MWIHGWATAEVYDASRGAGYYLSKYVGTDLCEPDACWTTEHFGNPPIARINGDRKDQTSYRLSMWCAACDVRLLYVSRHHRASGRMPNEISER